MLRGTERIRLARERLWKNHVNPYAPVIARIRAYRKRKEEEWQVVLEWRKQNPKPPMSGSTIERVQAYRKRKVEERNIYVPVSTRRYIMAENVKVAFPDEHYAWLEEVRKARGWDSIQEAIRSVAQQLQFPQQ